MNDPLKGYTRQQLVAELDASLRLGSDFQVGERWTYKLRSGHAFWNFQETATPAWSTDWILRTEPRRKCAPCFYPART
ncbi:MAG: hypothetical protein U5K31_02950 [Balneolaceae bacterium]|nr:hypothetical protein [Balneolaceae bacterium]